MDRDFFFSLKTCQLIFMSEFLFGSDRSCSQYNDEY